MNSLDIYKFIPHLKGDKTFSGRDEYINKTKQSLYADSETLKEEVKLLLTQDLIEYYKDPIEYKFNNLGFRDHKDILSKNQGCLALGDSFTEGEGVRYEDLWTFRLENRANIPVYNLGICGSGFDDWVRLLLRYIDRFDGDYVFLLGTSFGRYSFPLENRYYYPLEEELTQPLEFFIDNNFIKYNYQVKLLAMKEICNHYGKTLIFLDVHDIVPSPISNFGESQTHNFEFARDGKHLGRDFHEEVSIRFNNLIS